jgi:hypothetical protein
VSDSRSPKDKEVPLYWRWNVRRLAISAFLAIHLLAVGVINLPQSALRQRLFVPVIHYLLPIGLDQSWGMFAPNPVLHAMTMEVMTVDKNGLQRMFAFPKMTDFSVWRAIPRVRHSKFTSNCGLETNVSYREFAVRYAIRQLKIPADAFPVNAELFYQVRETPPPGDPPRDPMKPPIPQSLQTYRYPSMAEVQP